MKLRIFSTGLAALGTTLMLSACVPQGPGIPTVPTIPTTTKPNTTTTAPQSSVAAPRNLRLADVETINAGDPGTYNVFFKWDPSTTPGVKYCVSTIIDDVNNCRFENPYITDETYAGVGLVFEKNQDYKVYAVAVNESNKKSSVAEASWRIPTKVASPTNIKLTKVETISAGDPGTYNVFFKWDPSTTPNVKYFASTNIADLADITYNHPYAFSGTSTGFGLVFSRNVLYTTYVVAIDSSNNRSIVGTLHWQLP